MANAEQVEMLLRSVDEWNRWRVNNPDVEVDLSNGVFTGRDLPGADLSSANLVGAEMRDTVLQYADLTDADLTGAILIGARLDEATLIDATATRANLTGAWCRRADFDRATLIESTANKVKLIAASLVDTNCQGAQFASAQCDLANFDGAYLRNANLRSARFPNCTFRGANLDGANLLRSRDLTCDQLTGAKNWANTLRSHDLACGQPIPDVILQPQSVVQQQTADAASVDVSEGSEAGGRGRLVLKPVILSGQSAETARPAVVPPPFYDLVVRPEDRPPYLDYDLRPAAPHLRHGVKREEQLGAAQELAGHVRELLTQLRAASQERPPGFGHNQPPISDELISQIEAETEIVVANAKAPVPDLGAIHRFKSTMERLREFSSDQAGPLILSAGGVIATTIGAIITNLEYIVSLFQ